MVGKGLRKFNDSTILVREIQYIFNFVYTDRVYEFRYLVIVYINVMASPVLASYKHTNYYKYIYLNFQIGCVKDRLSLRFRLPQHGPTQCSWLGFPWQLISSSRRVQSCGVNCCCSNIAFVSDIILVIRLKPRYPSNYNSTG